MILDLEQIRSVVSDTVKVEEHDGMYRFFRFTEKEAAVDTDVDYVLAAYGTNDWGRPALPENANAFFEKLVKKYPDSKIFALTPIWRGDYDSPAIPGKFSQIEEIIREVCQKHGDKIQVISGWNLVPQEEAYFGDLVLHPNDEGFSYYYDNISKELKEIEALNFG